MTTGVLSYDAALGGGWPVGSWSEMIGNESHGKTLLAQSTIIANQTSDPKFTTCGWPASRSTSSGASSSAWTSTGCMFVPGNTMEQSYDIALKFMENRLVDLVIIDSLPAMIPTSEDDREFEELTIGKAALLNNKFFVRKATSAMRRSYTNEGPPVHRDWRSTSGVSASA